MYTIYACTLSMYDCMHVYYLYNYVFMHVYYLSIYISVYYICMCTIYVRLYACILSIYVFMHVYYLRMYTIYVCACELRVCKRSKPTYRHGELDNDDLKLGRWISGINVESRENRLLLLRREHSCCIGWQLMQRVYNTSNATSAGRIYKSF